MIFSKSRLGIFLGAGWFWEARVASEVVQDSVWRFAEGILRILSVNL